MDAAATTQRLDIRQADDRATPAQRAEAGDGDLEVGEAKRGLESLVANLGPSEWMRHRFGAFNVPTGADLLPMRLSEAVRLGLNLDAVRLCSGFDVLLAGFDNPTQFEATMFEVEIARWCHQRAAVSTLRFSPTYRVMGRERVADFEISTSLGRIACECKRPNLNGAERLTKITNAFDAALQQLPLGARFGSKLSMLAPCVAI